MKRKDIKSVQKRIDPMLRWTITWEIDIFSDQAKTPLEAAQEALKAINDKESIAHVFTVVDNKTGKKYSVDLDEIEGDVVQEIWEQY